MSKQGAEREKENQNEKKQPKAGHDMVRHHVCLFSLFCDCMNEADGEMLAVYGSNVQEPD